MFDIIKKDFTEELKVVETIPEPIIKEEGYREDVYLVAETSEKNFYESIDDLSPMKRREFEIDLNNQKNVNPVLINIDNIQNKLQKKSIFKQKLEKLGEIYKQIKNQFYGFFSLNVDENYNQSIFRIDINCSSELLGVLINLNTLFLYNIFKNEYFCFSLRLPVNILSHSSVVDFDWNKINPNEFFVLYRDYVCYYEFTNNNVFLTNYKKFENIISLKSNKSTKYELILYNNGASFALLDINKDIVFSKSFFMRKFKNIQWSSTSNFFVAYTDNSIYLYNMMDFSFKIWSNFKNKITAVNIKNEDNLIMVFVENTENFLYLISESTNDLYDLRKFTSYNSISNAYLHFHYKIHSKIFNFSISQDYIISKSSINKNLDRLILMFSNKNIKSQKLLRVYKIDNSDDVHGIKFSLSFEIYKFKKLILRDFTYFYDSINEIEVIYLLWGDGCITRTLLNLQMNNFN